jgi:RNA recognition motif-containing protein
VAAVIGLFLSSGSSGAVAAVVISSNSSGLCVAEDEEPTGRLFLRNLPFTTIEAELSDAFTDFGDLQEVHLVLDR